MASSACGSTKILRMNQRKTTRKYSTTQIYMKVLGTYNIDVVGEMGAGRAYMK